MEQKSLPEWVRTLRSMIFLIAAALFFCTFIAQLTYVDGRSMENSLEDGDRLILDKLSYRFHNPERFDIVVFPHMDGDQKSHYIKRIIGLPGETVYIHPSGKIYINRRLLEEPYGKETIQDPGIASVPITLGNDEYFVLGDNRNRSSDSRDPSVGVVKGETILGKAVFRVYPFSRLGTLP